MNFCITGKVNALNEDNTKELICVHMWSVVQTWSWLQWIHENELFCKRTSLEYSEKNGD